MPHLSIEYSANLDGRLDIQALCEALAEAIVASGLFEPGAVRVRAHRASAFVIADRHAENGFLDMAFRMGKGRTQDEKKRVGEAIFAMASERCRTLLETPHLALSLEVREIDAELSWKKNSIHPRLRGK